MKLILGLQNEAMYKSKKKELYDKEKFVKRIFSNFYDQLKDKEFDLDKIILKVTVYDMFNIKSTEDFINRIKNDENLYIKKASSVVNSSSDEDDSSSSENNSDEEKQKDLGVGIIDKNKRKADNVNNLENNPCNNNVMNNNYVLDAEADIAEKSTNKKTMKDKRNNSNKNRIKNNNMDNNDISNNNEEEEEEEENESNSEYDNDISSLKLEIFQPEMNLNNNCNSNSSKHSYNKYNNPNHNNPNKIYTPKINYEKIHNNNIYYKDNIEIKLKCSNLKLALTKIKNKGGELNEIGEDILNRPNLHIHTGKSGIKDPKTGNITRKTENPTNTNNSTNNTNKCKFILQQFTEKVKYFVDDSHSDTIYYILFYLCINISIILSTIFLCSISIDSDANLINKVKSINIFCCVFFIIEIFFKIFIFGFKIFFNSNINIMDTIILLLSLVDLIRNYLNDEEINIHLEYYAFVEYLKS